MAEEQGISRGPGGTDLLKRWGRQPHLFERFRQHDGSMTRAAGGLGLGLATVRHLAELHGGTVTATSPGKGRGSTFTVRLPLRAGSAA